jgi:hypothetical protein
MRIVTVTGPSLTGSASAIVTTCGTVTGGKDDFPGRTLVVTVGGGAGCRTALRVAERLGTTPSENRTRSTPYAHALVYGWKCAAVITDGEVCRHHESNIAVEIR